MCETTVVPRHQIAQVASDTMNACKVLMEHVWSLLRTDVATSAGQYILKGPTESVMWYSSRNIKALVPGGTSNVTRTLSKKTYCLKC